MSAVESGATGEKGSYTLVELNAQTDAIIDSVPEPAFRGLGSASSTAPVDRIGVGDGLSVSVFDRGFNALFASVVGTGAGGAGGASGASSLVGASTGLGVNTIPKVTVDAGGDVLLPYAGKVHVSGMTTEQAASAIQSALKGKAVNPQVVVSLVDNITNSVTIVGEVHSPGRYALTNGGDHLLDLLAEAGGPSRQASDLRVIISRQGKTASVPLTDLFDQGSQNIRLAPRDQVRLVYVPRTFTTFGAFMRSAQITIDDRSLTLAGALGKAGGLDPNSANATSVLLFRFERPAVADALSVHAPVSSKGVPIIYHLNMRDPEEWFVANRFKIRPDDLIYVPQSNYVEVQKFLAIVGAVSSVAYNLRVTSQITR